MESPVGISPDESEKPLPATPTQLETPSAADSASNNAAQSAPISASILTATKNPTPDARVCLYVGVPKCGKTHLGCVHLASYRDGDPALILDSMGASNFAASEHRVESVEAVLQRLYVERRHAVFTPWDDDDGAFLFEAIADQGGVHLFVDESSRWLTGRRSCDELEALLRAARHRGVTAGLATQHFSGDVPAFIFNVEAVFYLFRTHGRRALERLEDEFDDPTLPPLVANLPLRAFVRYPREIPTTL